MTQGQIDICKEVLKSFIFKLRTQDICRIIFHYYNDSLINNDRDYKTYPVDTPEYNASFNTDRVKRQIRKKILSTENTYWHLNEAKIKIVEGVCQSKEFDKHLTNYMDSLWTCSLHEQRKAFEKKEQEAKEKDEAKLRDILKNNYDLYKEVVTLILNDNSEYPYKSDKIKVLLELELDVETIFLLLQTKEKWISPRGYINKYYEERKEGIKARKIAVYELGSTIKHITSQLKSKM